MIALKWLRTLIKVLKRSAKKKRKFIIATYEIGQYWNTKHLIVGSSGVGLINFAGVVD